MVPTLMAAEEETEFLLCLLLLLMMEIPGVLIAYCGFRLAKNETKDNIKGAAGALAVVMIVAVSFLAEPLVPDKIPFVDIIYFPVLFLLIVSLYVVLSRFVMIREGLTPSRGEFIGKEILVLTALGIWFTVSQLVHEFAPGRENYDSPIESPWLWIENFGSILAAWVFYRLAMRIIEKRRDEEIDQPDGGSAAASIGMTQPRQ
jgi:hypothetical protein